MIVKRPKKMDDEQVRSIAKSAAMDAVDFVESEVANHRIRAQRYYDGEVDIGHEEGRSKVVATKIRDTIRAVKPQLMRVFLQSRKPVEFVPRGPDDAEEAEQMTEYITHRFYENDGYRVLNDAFDDALKKKVGIVKVWWDESDDVTIHEFENLTDIELEAILSEDNVELIDQDTFEGQEIDALGYEIGIRRHNIRIQRTTTTGKLCFDSIPPEEFFVDREARNIRDNYVVGHRTEKRVGELVDMGYNFEDVTDLSSLDSSDTTSDQERYERRGFDEGWSSSETEDPSMRLVGYTEVYMKIDVDGNGIPSLHKICLGGGDYQLLDIEPCSHIPFAVFEIDPEPHTFFGRSICDLLFDEQDTSTVMLRGILDNVQIVNNPREEVNDELVNMDDVLNNEIGGIVRSKQIGSIKPLTVPFVAGDTLAALQYMDMEVEAKTGVVKAATGLSADALQNNSATAVNAITTAANSQAEYMARNLAEGGMRQLFSLMLKLTVENVDEAEMLRFSGGTYTIVDPRSWDTTKNMMVNVGIGTGREGEKAAAIEMTIQRQMMIYQQYGPNNGIVTLTNIRNALHDQLELSGIRSSDRYYTPIDPMIEQDILQKAAQAAASQQQSGSPEAQALVQGEQIKAASAEKREIMKLQAQQQQKLADFQFRVMELMMNDDLTRDQMVQNLMIEAGKILGQYGTAIDTATIASAQEAPRGYPRQG